MKIITLVIHDNGKVQIQAPQLTEKEQQKVVYALQDYPHIIRDGKEGVYKRL